MKVSEAKKQQQASAQRSSQPFFGAKSSGAFFSKARSNSTLFFQRPSPAIQANVTVGTADEQEADRVAATMATQINDSSFQDSATQQLVQRMGKKDGELQMKRITQRQTKDSLEQSRKKNSTGLPDNLKAGVENLSGLSLDDVKVHRNSDKPAQLQAHAYAQGTDIYLGPGKENHLPHEAWHVVQQKQGRVRPTMQMKGTVKVSNDTALEEEADIMGNKADTDTSQAIRPLVNTHGSVNTIVQGAFFGKLVVFLAMMSSLFELGEARFSGKYGRLLVNPAHIGEQGKEYAHLWTSLNELEEEIFVEEGSLSFAPNGKKGPTLNLPGGVIMALHQDAMALRDKNKNHDVNEDAFADNLAAVTHELSHAADSMVHGKELIGEKGTADTDAQTFNVIQTELTAWASEAITIKERGKGDTKLLDGWKNVQPSTLSTWDGLKQARKIDKNEVAARYYRYVVRELDAAEISTIQKWHKKYWAQVQPIMQKEKNRVLSGEISAKDEL